MLGNDDNAEKGTGTGKDTGTHGGPGRAPRHMITNAVCFRARAIYSHVTAAQNASLIRTTSM
jgi:hypothetical protein